MLKEVKAILKISVNALETRSVLRKLEIPAEQEHLLVSKARGEHLRKYYEPDSVV